MKGIESLHLTGFRGVWEGTVEGFADVSVLVGRNNSGKTTVAEAITRAASFAGGKDPDVVGRSRVSYWRDVRCEPEVWTLDLVYGAKAPAGATVEVRGHEWGWTLELAFDRSGNCSYTPKGTTPGDVGFAFARDMMIYRFSDLSERSIEQALWPRLLADRRDKVLVNALNDIFGISIEQIQLLPNARFMLRLPDHDLSLDAYGDGTRAAARCLMTLTAMQNTLFILEEPESHQHPGSLERLAGALCRLAHSQNVQLLLTTHSAECVRAFMKGSEAAGSTFSLIHLKLDDGLLESRHFDRSAVDTLLGSGLDVRSLDLYA